MAKYTNYTRGPRGISMKDGSTVWLDPGQSKDIAKAEIVEPLPDLGNKPDAESEDGAEIDALKEKVAALTKQVDELTKARDEATKKADEAEKSNAALTKQVDELTKAADKK